MVLAMDILKHMTFLGDIKTMMETKKMTSLGLLLLDSHVDHIQITQTVAHSTDPSIHPAER